MNQSQALDDTLAALALIAVVLMVNAWRARGKGGAAARAG